MSAEPIDRSRLAEIDGRLREIQEGLLQDAQAPAVPAPIDPRGERLIAELRELADRQERLLGELRSLLGFAQRSPHETS